jgi:hypothetical protein
MLIVSIGVGMALCVFLIYTIAARRGGETGAEVR